MKMVQMIMLIGGVPLVTFAFVAAVTDAQMAKRSEARALSRCISEKAVEDLFNTTLDRSQNHLWKANYVVGPNNEPRGAGETYFMVPGKQFNALLNELRRINGFPQVDWEDEVAKTEAVPK